MTATTAVPRELGFAMPAEWEPHAGCLMVWPTRAELWGSQLDDAKRDYALVADAIGAAERVVMVCTPGSAAEVRDRCGSEVTTLELPVDDSWARDSGPVFVRDAAGAIAVVSFRFNAWGERWHPYADDDLLAGRIADAFGLTVFDAPMVLEGGGFLVDGQGTLVTTEQCLLNPNRNPGMSALEIEAVLRDHLGVDTVIWLPYGHSLDVGPAGTDGHVDGVAQYVEPGVVLLELPCDPASPDHARSRANLEALERAHDARGRRLDVVVIDPGPDPEVSYVNHYLANGRVVVPVAGVAHDDAALDTLREIYDDREVVGVPGTVLAHGGGGPHCITQQIPAGVVLP
ncbi:MAG TPA: agmatine deiminase family protein [Candidatus Nanopelagicales bacterium]|nr:agmatine deiminase family protein [Candidatus Nanopelagicales bacterium]